MTLHEQPTLEERWDSAFKSLKWIAVAIAIFVASLFITWGIYAFFTYGNNRGNAVIEDTINTAQAAHEQLVALRKEMSGFDETARKHFGLEHTWPEVDSELHPPTHIRAWLRSLPTKEAEEAQLLQYSRLVQNRAKLYTRWDALSSKTRSLVKTQGKDSTPDQIMEADELYRVDIADLKSELERQTLLLNQVGQAYLSATDDLEEQQ